MHVALDVNIPDYVIVGSVFSLYGTGTHPT